MECPPLTRNAPRVAGPGSVRGNGSLATLARAALATLIALLIAGCGAARPTRPPDLLACGLERFAVKDVYTQWRIYRSTIAGTQSLSDEKPSFNVLALSAGGEYGAYGAGFLVGWAALGNAAKPSPRADIQVVTGVSTGAILATHAFLGDDLGIEEIYRAISGRKIYRERSGLEYLWANSLLDTAGKDKLIADGLTSSAIQRVADSKGRFLYIGIVDLDTGRFLRIDMVALAGTIQPKSLRDDCYRAVIGASSAIPIAFPPKFVDEMMLVDGGARRHLFLTELPDDAKKPGVVRRLYSFVHGDLDVGCTRTKNGVLQIAGRAAALFTDQGFKDSLRLSHQLAIEAVPSSSGPATEPLFETYYSTAADAAQVCAPKLAECTKTGGALADDQFCNPFMNCLADRGREDGARYAQSGKWLEFRDLNLSSVPDCRAPAVGAKAPNVQSPRAFAR